LPLKNKQKNIKLTQAKYIALPAGLPSGLNKKMQYYDTKCDVLTVYEAPTDKNSCQLVLFCTHFAVVSRESFADISKTCLHRRRLVSTGRAVGYGGEL